MTDKERAAMRMAMLYEVTGLMGDVLKRLEQREGTSSKHVVNIRVFVDTFCEEWKKANGIK